MCTSLRPHFSHISRPLLLCLANGIAMPCETACMLELCCKASSTAVVFRARMVGALRIKRSRSGVNSFYPATKAMWTNVHDFRYRQSTIHHGISNISETSLSSLFARKKCPMWSAECPREKSKPSKVLNHRHSLRLVSETRTMTSNVLLNAVSLHARHIATIRPKCTSVANTFFKQDTGAWRETNQTAGNHRSTLCLDSAANTITTSLLDLFPRLLNCARLNSLFSTLR